MSLMDSVFNGTSSIVVNAQRKSVEFIHAYIYKGGTRDLFWVCKPFWVCEIKGFGPVILSREVG